MLSEDFIRETWEIETGVSEQGVEWDVIGFAHAIERAAREVAIEECAELCKTRHDYEFPNPNSGYALGYSDCASGCYGAIRALLEGS